MNPLKKLKKRADALLRKKRAEYPDMPDSPEELADDFFDLARHKRKEQKQAEKEKEGHL